jgi:hypothetical protein
MDWGNKVQKTADTFPSVGCRTGSSPSLETNLKHAVEIIFILRSLDTDGLGHSQQDLKLTITRLILNEFYLVIMSLLIQF